ncbi:MBL fold metallo-hydrolase [Longispora sp. K20-0274]|uniref:MBL fold metallo-hydrolase n=1 Tax=Longispora sp. K20-0274 TaxID=3088255 RepID=UPI00399C2362
MTELVIHTHSAGEPGLFVNSYLVETPNGVAVVDTNLLVADIEALVARVAAIRKPLIGVFVTHAHPDHFNGVAALVRDRDVPVYATAGVAAAIRRVADAKRAQWGPVYGDQWPADTYYPTVELADAEQVVLDGVTYTAREFGPGESHADSVFLASAPGAAPVAFIGDLAFHGTHSYTADGHGADWLDTLDTLTAELGPGVRLLPGHGAPADVGLLAEQRRYLLHYRELVRRLAGGGTALDEAAKAELEREMTRFQPGPG